MGSKRESVQTDLHFGVSHIPLTKLRIKHLEHYIPLTAAGATPPKRPVQLDF